MADQIYADGPMATPATYTVPGSSEIVPIAVQAVLDGTSASGAFVPTLIFRSQAGHVIARVPTSTTVAAGASAEVSWFPHVGAAAAAAATTPQVSWGRVRDYSVLTNYSANGALRLASTISTSSADIYTNDTATFGRALATNPAGYPAGTYAALSVKQSGVYLVCATCQMLAVAAGGRGEMRVTTVFANGTPNYGAIPEERFGRESATSPDVWDPVLSGMHIEHIALFDFSGAGTTIDGVTGYVTVPALLIPEVTATGGGNFRLSNVEVSAVRLGPQAYYPPNW